MDHVTSTSPNWVVESGSPNSANAQEVEKPNSEWKIEDQPRPEQHILFDSHSSTQEEVDKSQQDESIQSQTNLSERAKSPEKHNESDVSVEKNLFMTDDGEGNCDNDGVTTTKQEGVDKVEEQEKQEQKIPLTVNVPSPEKQEKPVEEKKEESIEENLLTKDEGDANDGKTGQSEELKLVHDEKNQQDTPLVEQPSTVKQVTNTPIEEKVDENLLVTEDGHDGKKSSGHQEVHMAKQEEEPRQETHSVENPPATDEKLSNQAVEESLDQIMSGLSIQETEPSKDQTFHAEAELKEGKDEVTEQKNDTLFQETGPDGERQTAQPIDLQKDDPLIQGNEIIMEEEKVSTAVEEEKVPVAVKEEKAEVTVEEEMIPKAVEAEKVSEAVAEEKVPEAVAEEKVPVAMEQESTPVAVEKENIPVAMDQENIPAAMEQENIPAAMEQETTPVVNEENIPVAMEEQIPKVQTEIVQATPMPEPEMNTRKEIIDMEPKDVIPQPVAVASEVDHVSQSAEINESSEIKVEESKSEEIVDVPMCDPIQEAVSLATIATVESASPVMNSDVQARSPTPPTALPISSSSPSSKVETTPPGDMLHHIKNIQFKDKNVGIVTQNENGPCPLVAIINVLLLRRQITLPTHLEIVSAAKLMEYIGDAMLESVPKNLSGEVRLNYEQNMHDAMAVLPKLQTGLDVNVKFTGVRDFEYTPECIIFDLLRIPLFHGWLVDPQTPEVVAAVGQAGYNQLVEKVISQKCSNDENAVLEALVIENFLERSASQLTYHGLSELTTSMEDDEIGVLFRNNHFSTIYKRQKELLQLVTDQGFLGESSVVWETLGSIDGDGQFVDSHFRTVPPKPELAPSGDSASPNTSAQLTAEQQIDHEFSFLVALSLQEEQQQEQPAAVQEEVVRDVGEDVAKTLAEDEKTTQELMDLELARQLQQEEERQAAEAETVERETAAASSQSPPATGQRSPPPPQPSKKKDCTFL
ncbi:titin-like isoform X1 [Daphnia pulex]|uniref:titin-like isoform X1 n=1 Tax=Daphnia pulex TaxID=6669 RepID=UPI001EDDFD43|nr:titin-like isoform X1 [Daphnia pulex]XP_046439685.1 titin-like isoform X1 [Daphnia pulex]XP_046439686.1 titin-like isoform X1 [Daphnia pulex]